MQKLFSCFGTLRLRASAFVFSVQENEMTLVESFKMAVSAIGAHKLRSILTLVGIVAGVSAIISVMTGVSVIQTQIERS